MPKSPSSTRGRDRASMLSGSEWAYAALFVSAPVAIRYAFVCVRDIVIARIALKDVPPEQKPRAIQALTGLAGAFYRRPEPTGAQLAAPIPAELAPVEQQPPAADRNPPP